MSDSTKIEWADATWNPITGCTRVSAGCENCYIDWAPPFRIEGRHFTDKSGERSHAIGSTTGVRLHEDRLDQPLRWRKPRRVFVNSLSDLFHDEIPDEFIARVFAVMALAEKHTFQVLTKRHGRMRSLLNSQEFRDQVEDRADLLNNQTGGNLPDPMPWPLSNVWLGVSVEDQKAADLRIPALLGTPAAIRFLSCEPLLGEVYLTNDLRWRPEPCPSGCGCSLPTDPDCFDCGCDGPCCMDEEWGYRRPDLDWVIVGGESGQGARPMHPDWARSLRDQCRDAGVPYFFKQRGEWTWSEPGQFRMPVKPYTDRVAVMHPAGTTALTESNGFDPFRQGHPDWATRIERVGKKAAGRELDGRTWDEFPDGGTS